MAIATAAMRSTLAARGQGRASHRAISRGSDGVDDARRKQPLLMAPGALPVQHNVKFAGRGIKSRPRGLSPPSAIPHWINPESPEPFLAYNTAILLPWMLMIIAPKWDLTRKLLEPTWFMVPYALVDTVYFFMTAVLDAQAGKDVNAELIFLFTDAITDPEKMLSLFNNSAYAAQDWVHLCTWDMLAGRWIWLDSLATGVPVRFALLTAFSSGPPGLLIYLISRGLFQKPEDSDSQVSKV